MNKAVIVINGAGGVGKDTLCDLAEKHLKIRNISTITPIKELARMCGWNGAKDDKSRKFLADMKQLTVAYNDFPTNWAMGVFREFMTTDEQILFVHIREPEEIAKFVKATDGFAKTLLVRGGERMKKSHYGNAADDCVENYSYDYYFMNDKSLAEAERNFLALLAEVLDCK
ncbi:MAG: hypothetical protein IJ459_06240 [Clostridia bacterium]|nr:hypothetical protein [Clostridia bacterium]